MFCDYIDKYNYNGKAIAMTQNSEIKSHIHNSIIPVKLM